RVRAPPQSGRLVDHGLPPEVLPGIVARRLPLPAADDPPEPRGRADPRRGAESVGLLRLLPPLPEGPRRARERAQRGDVGRRDEGLRREGKRPAQWDRPALPGAHRRRQGRIQVLGEGRRVTLRRRTRVRTAPRAPPRGTQPPGVRHAHTSGWVSRYECAPKGPRGIPRPRRRALRLP